MATPDPGLSQEGAFAEDPNRGAVVYSKEEGNHIQEEEDRPIAPDQADPKFETSRSEKWAYYSYYIGVTSSVGWS